MTHEEAFTLLESLGSSPEEIRDNLIAQGITNNNAPMRCSSCPIALFLKKNGAEHAYVGIISFVLEECSDQSNLRFAYPLPKACSDFVDLAVQLTPA